MICRHYPLLMMAQPSNHQHACPAARKPGHLSRRTLTRLLCVLLALQPMLAQAAPVLVQSATFTAPAGPVSLLAKTDTDYIQKTRREADLLWWNERDQGRFKETVRPVEIEAGGGLRINAGRGVVIEYHQTGDLRASLGQLAEAPGLGWIASLQADPRVDWRGVEAAFREWDYEQSGLTEAGAALVALVTAVATGGIDFSQLLTSGALSGVKATAFNAGMQALTVNASVALVNNKGDLAATLEQLASTDTLRSLATAMVTAGLTAHLEQAAGLGGELTRTAQYMERGLIRATVRAGVGTALQGGSLDENLVQALQWQAIDTIGEVAAREIGKAYANARKDANGKITDPTAQQYITHKLAHAVLGCTLGQIGAGDCAAGAASGALGAAVAEGYERLTYAEFEAETSQMMKVAAETNGGELSAAQKVYYERLFLDWRRRGLDITKLSGALFAMAAGGEADTGALVAGNAAEHNIFPALFVIAKLGVAAYTAYEVYDTAQQAYAFYQRIAAGEEISDAQTRKFARVIGMNLAQDVALSKLNVLKTAAVLVEKAGLDKKAGELRAYISKAKEAPFKKLYKVSDRQLQRKFKHAVDFGVKGNYNKANAKKFDQAIREHINAPDTEEIRGIYRGNPVVFQLDPKTRLTVT